MLWEYIAAFHTDDWGAYAKFIPKISTELVKTTHGK